MSFRCPPGGGSTYEKLRNSEGCILQQVVVVLAIIGCFVTSVNAEARIDFSALPVKGIVTMIDLGAKKCIPCKMMAPILEKMEKRYEGKAAVIFIDVWEHREQASRFRIRAIPTQIFFDPSGKEVYRHVGFMGEEAITQVMEKLGVRL